MTISNPMLDLNIRTPPTATSQLGPPLALAAGLAAAVAALALFSQRLHGDLVPAALSGMFFVLAAVIAALTWRRPRKTPRLSYWDVAGVFTLIGVCIAATVEPEQMINIVSPNRQP